MHPTSRHWYLMLLAVAAIGAAFFFFYRTESPTTIAKFGGVSLRIEYATTEAEREKGLGGRASVPGGYGMLFVFPTDAPYGFWMKDMLVPIDMFWLNSQGQVVSIASNVATSTYPHVFYPTAPARYVLETAAGFANRYDIATGTSLQLKNIPVVSE